MADSKVSGEHMLAPGVADRARANGGPVALSRPQAGESARVAEPRLRSRAVDAAKVQMAAFGLALALVELTLLLSVPQGGLAWLVSLFPVVGLVYLGTGVVASLSRPSNAMGTILAVGGLAWIVAGFVNADVPALIGAGLVVATVPLAIVVHLLHAFPSGKLRGRLSLWTVLAGYGACLLLQAPQWLFGEGPGGPFTVLELANRPDLARWGQWMQWAVGSCVMVATAAVLLRRLRGMTLAQRRVSAPLFAYGIFAVLFVPVSGQLAIVFPQARIGVITAQLGVLLLVPLAFVVVMLRGGFARTGALQELGAWLGQDHGANRGLREALAQALGDDSLELFYWVPATGAFVDGSGRKVALPMLGSERGVVEVSLGDRPVGAIAYDATLIADGAEVRAAGRVVALALESERLTAELRASRERLKRSRARIVRATDAERRRIARDLHDGLQARLVLAAMGADRLRSDETLAPDLRASATKLQAELQASIEELRELVHGVMPAALTERGLFAAIRELVGGLPVQATLEVEQNGDRLPAAVESAGYFVVTEALANALKHSGARHVAVRAGVVRGALRVEVSDDGVGGARFEGAGLQGMADRVEALDGHLSIESPSGAGTRVVATVPCGS